MVVLGFLMSFLFEDFYFTEKKNSLLDHGRNVNNLILKWDGGQINKEQVIFNLISLDRFINARIVVINKAGLVILDSRSADEAWQGAALTTDEINKVLKGKLVTKRGMAGSQFDTSSLTVALPLLIDEQIQGMILMNAPVYGISTSITQVYRLFFIGALISLLLAFLLSSHVSMMTTKPLRKMNEAALEMAQGKLDTRVDVTSKDEIGQLAQNLNYMASELSNMESMRRDFVANVSHELRSPLTSIRGFIQAMSDGTIPVELYPKYLGIVYDETNRLNRLINELLDLSRIESGNFKFEKAEFDIHNLMRRVGERDRERFQNTIPQQKILNFANYKVGVIHGDEFASRHLKRSELLIKLRETVVEPFLDGEALDIILFGHCHQPILESIVAEFYPFGKFSLKTKKNVLLFNPGMPVRNRSLSSMGYITFMENSFNIELKVFTTKK